MTEVAIVDRKIDALVEFFTRQRPAPWRYPDARLQAFTAEIPYDTPMRVGRERYRYGSFGLALQRQGVLPLVVAEHKLNIEYGRITSWHETPISIRLDGVSCAAMYVGDAVSPGACEGTYDGDDIVDAGFFLELTVGIRHGNIYGAQIVDVADHDEAMRRLAA